MRLCARACASAGPGSAVLPCATSSVCLTLSANAEGQERGANGSMPFPPASHAESPAFEQGCVPIFLSLSLGPRSRNLTHDRARH
jgi:hypothetical protein